MKPVMQTFFGDKEGNCFSACIASLLEVEIDELKIPAALPDWYEIAQEVLKKHGYTMLQVILENNKAPDGLDVYFIATGYTNRYDGKVLHSVIYRGNILTHDPLPNGNGIKAIENAIFLLPLAD